MVRIHMHCRADTLERIQLWRDANREMDGDMPSMARAVRTLVQRGLKASERSDGASAMMLGPDGIGVLNSSSVLPGGE